MLSVLPVGLSILYSFFTFVFKLVALLQFCIMIMIIIITTTIIIIIIVIIITITTTVTSFLYNYLKYV